MAATPAAASVVESDLVWIVEDEVVPEDLYAVGNEVRISGRVEGNLVAGGHRPPGGGRSGDGFGYRPWLPGWLSKARWEGSMVARAAADVTVTGRVGGDLVVGTLDLLVEGAVGRDILAAAWSGSAARQGSGEI